MNNPLLNLNVGIVSFMAYPEIIKGEGPVVESIIKIILKNILKLDKLFKNAYYYP